MTIDKTIRMDCYRDAISFRDDIWLPIEVDYANYLMDLYNPTRNENCNRKIVISHGFSPEGKARYIRELRLECL